MKSNIEIITILHSIKFTNVILNVLRELKQPISLERDHILK